MLSDFSNNDFLIKSLQQGREDAYAYLMDTYYERLCVYAKSLCKDVYLSEDIVQNIYMRIWERRKNLKENFSIKNYLYQSVYNEFINQYRKKASLLNLEKEYIDTLNNILEDEDTNELSRIINIVKNEIQQLPPKIKEIFILGKQEGLTYGEIAEHLGISFRTVENRMSKAFSIIREKAGSKIDTILFILFGRKKNAKVQL